MKKWLKRIRGAVGTALMWAVAWCGTGILLALLGLFGTLAPVDYALFAGVFAIMGFIGGAAFSTVVAIGEGRRRFDEMSLLRFAAWGALGGGLMQLVLFGLGQPTSIATVGLFVLMGSGSATGSLALARKGDDRDLLDAGANVDDIGLTEEEKRELLTE